MTAKIGELWQLYDEQGRALKALGANKTDIFNKRLLHGASHVWIWRQTNKTAEILLQKRAATKRTWPNLYDISAAGHIDLEEDPLTAALRETKEEVNLAIAEKDIKSIGIYRTLLVAPSGDVENEFQWLYLYKLSANQIFNLDQREVSKVEWKNLSSFKKDLIANPGKYVPHGPTYYKIIVSAIEREAEAIN